MGTNLEELRAIYKALGGNEADVAGLTNNAAVLAKIALQAATVATAATTAELPTVSAADDGDILTVVSGKWAKADAPKELPTVTADDNGRVLTVVEGAWAVAALPQG